MRHFPVFLDVKDRRILVTGGDETAVAKLRLLLKTEGRIVVFSTNPCDQILEWETAGRLSVLRRTIERLDFENAVMVYAAEDDAQRDAATAKLAGDAGVLFNVVDNLEASEFITPAIVDRDPVTIAIGTEGTAPVLARKIKSEIEESLPGDLGLLARIGAQFRSRVATLEKACDRRDFWTRFFFGKGSAALKQSGEVGVQNALEELLAEAKSKTSDHGSGQGYVFFVGAGPGDPELLTLKARRVLHEADVVIYDHHVNVNILELARREARIVETGRKGFRNVWKQKDINSLISKASGDGQHVVRLLSGDACDHASLSEEIHALDEMASGWDVIPGISNKAARIPVSRTYQTSLEAGAV